VDLSQKPLSSPVDYRARAGLIALAVAAVAVVVVVLALQPRLELPALRGGGVRLELFLYSEGPVESGSTVYVCPLLFVNGTPLRAKLRLSMTSDRVLYEESEVECFSCSAVEVRRVVTNRLWVSACYGPYCVERELPARGPIVVATSDIIMLLVAMNIVQSAVIVALIVYMRRGGVL